MQVNRARYDRESIDDLVTTVAVVVADMKGVDPLDYQALPIMCNFVDMEWLENTFCDPDLNHRTHIEDVNFFYAGYNIRLGTDGWVTVYEKQ